MVLLAAESRWHFSRHVARLLLRRLGSGPATCTAGSSSSGSRGGGRTCSGGGLSVGHCQALGIVAALWRGGSITWARGAWGWGGRGGGSRAGGGRAALCGRRLGWRWLCQVWHYKKSKAINGIKYDVSKYMGIYKNYNPETIIHNYSHWWL